MPTNLPKTSVKFLVALLKHQVENLLGKDAAGILGDDVQEKIDDWLKSEKTEKALLKAAQQAQIFLQDKRNCPDDDLRYFFRDVGFGDLPTVQEALAELPQAMDASGVTDALRESFLSFSTLTASQQEEGVKLYTDALLRAAGTLEPFTLPIIQKVVQDNSKKLDSLGVGQAEIKAVLERILSRERHLPSPTQKGDLPVDSFFHHPKDDFFVDRDEILNRLASMLKTNRRTVVITGLIGTGKTALGIEFAYRYGYQYRGVVWLDLASVVTFDDFIGQITRTGKAHQLSPVDIVRKWKEHGPQLLILDGFEETSYINEVFAWLQHSSIHLLILSCRYSWPTSLGLQVINLDELPSNDVCILLNKMFPLMGNDILLDVQSRLGNLPLAIRSLSNRVKGQTIPTHFVGMKDLSSLDAMIEKLNSRFRRITLYAKRIFLTAGYCAPNTPIPTHLFDLALGISSDECDEGLDSLRDEGFIKWNGSEVVINPLISEYARLKCKEELENVLIARALRDSITQLEQSVSGDTLQHLAIHQENLKQVLGANNAKK